MIYHPLKTAKPCLSNKLKLNPKRQKKNKNHFRSISGQTSALARGILKKLMSAFQYVHKNEIHPHECLVHNS